MFKISIICIVHYHFLFYYHLSGTDSNVLTICWQLFDYCFSCTFVPKSAAFSNCYTSESYLQQSAWFGTSLPGVTIIAGWRHLCSALATNLTCQGCILFRLICNLFHLWPSSLELLARWTTFQQTFAIQLPKGTENIFIPMLFTLLRCPGAIAHFSNAACKL